MLRRTGGYNRYEFAPMDPAGPVRLTGLIPAARAPDCYGLFGDGAPCGAGAGAGGAKNGGTVAAGGMSPAPECCLVLADAIPALPRLPKSSFDIA